MGCFVRIFSRVLVVNFIVFYSTSGVIHLEETNYWKEDHTIVYVIRPEYLVWRSFVGVPSETVTNV